MRLGCDLDGVLANLHGAFAATALELFPDLDRTAVEAPTFGASPPVEPSAGAAPEGPPVPPVESELAVSSRQTDAVWRRRSGIDNFWRRGEIESGDRVWPPRPRSGAGRSSS
jgi:hypothetical protein